MSNKPIRIRVDPARQRVIAEAVAELRKRGWLVITFGDSLDQATTTNRNRSTKNEP